MNYSSKQNAVAGAFSLLNGDWPEELAKEALIVEYVSALLTDLHLPTIDGFELIGRVRAEGRTQKVPIIVISGDTDPKTPEIAYRIGADASFAKPYSPERVRQTLERLLEAC